MKAWVYRRYGSPDVLAYEEIEAKVPGAKEIAIRVERAASTRPTGTSCAPIRSSLGSPWGCASPVTR